MTSGISSSGMPGPVSRIETYCPPAPVQPILIEDLPAVRREFDRIGQQVEHDLAHRALVHPDARQMRLDSFADGDLALARAQCEQVPAILDDAGERHGVLAQFVASGLDARQVEDLVDERQKMLAARVDVGRIFLVGRHDVRAEQLALHHFGKAEDRVERRAQFVAHRREEARFREIGFLRAVARLVRYGLRLFEFGDQLVLLRAEGDLAERCVVQAVGERDERTTACRRRTASAAVSRCYRRRAAPSPASRASVGRIAAIDGPRDGRGRHRVHRADQHQDDEEKRVGVRPAGRQEGTDDARPRRRPAGPRSATKRRRQRPVGRVVRSRSRKARAQRWMRRARRDHEDAPRDRLYPGDPVRRHRGDRDGDQDGDDLRRSLRLAA